MYKRDLIKPQNLYGNILVSSPDGKPMFRCSAKRADRYLTKNIAIKINNQHIMLTFKPKGLGFYGKQELTDIIQNICCVCGSDKKLLKHNIVPKRYFRFIDLDWKSKNFSNRVLLCWQHANKWEIVSNSLVKEIANVTGIKLEGGGVEISSKLKKAKSAARALLQTKDILPEEVKKQKLKIVKEYLEHEEMTSFPLKENEKEHFDLLKSLANEESYVSFHEHGKNVVKNLLDQKEFIEFWRENFVVAMQPQFPPSHLRYLEVK